MKKHKIDWPAVGIAIETARKRLGLKQKEVCDQAKINQSTYSQIESGKRGAGSTILAQICAVLHLDLSELVGLQPDPTSAQRQSIDALCRTVIDIQESVEKGGTGIIDSLTKFLNEFGPEVVAAGADASPVPAPKAPEEQPQHPTLPTVHLKKGPAKGGILHPVFRNLAAGNAGQIERLPEEIHVQEFAALDETAMGIFVVSGHSMEPTLMPGDRVAVSRFENPIHLGIVDGEGEKVRLADVARKVRDGDLAVVDHDGEGLRVKRIRYESGNGRSWALFLCSDNAEEYPREMLTKNKSLTIYGVVVGKAE